MKLSLFCLSLLILGSASLPVRAQDKMSRASHRNLSIYKKIEQAYRKGTLSIDKKVLYKFYARSRPDKLPREYQTAREGPLKCGTPAIADLLQYRSQLSATTVREIQSMIGPPGIQAAKTYTSPSNKFTIHYDTSGEHAVPAEDDNKDSIPDYVEEVAAAADSSYRHMVHNLGYTNPIPAGSSYDVVIENLESYYGETKTPSPYGGDTYILIENDFAEGFPANDDPEGDRIGAAKVTMAHEFKHAVQYEATQWQGDGDDVSGDSDLWSEMDATLMEEVVYDNVNDYYNYISAETFTPIFLDPATSFYPGSYEDVSWALYFEEKFGSQFWVQVWDRIKEDPEHITMVDAMTEQLGTTDDFARNYIESHLWHWASGPDNTHPGFGFEESEAYPDPTINYNFFGSDSLNLPQNQTDSLQPFSAKYVEVTPSSFSGFVSIELTGFTKSKVGTGAIAYFKDGTVEPLVLYSENQGSLSFQTAWAWEELTKVGIIVANGNTEQHAGYRLYVRTHEPEIVQLKQNYPNPFTNQTVIKYSIPERGPVQLEIYDILGRKVATLVDNIQPQGIYAKTFNSTDLASGIYFYRLNTGGESQSKKMTVIK